MAEKKYKKNIPIYFFRCDLKRMFHGAGFYLAFLISIVILLRPLHEAFAKKMYGTFFQFLSAPLASSDFTPFAALFCVIPYAWSFCEDYNSGYIKDIISRIGIKKYSLQRCFVVMLSGGMLMATVFLTVILVCAGLANMPETSESAAFLKRTIWADMDLLFVGNGAVVACFRVLLAFLFGSVWALIGLLISIFITNRYITLIAPFVVYQILWFLLDENAFNPVYQLRGDSDYLPSLGFILGYQLCLIIICITISCIGIRKKVGE